MLEYSHRLRTMEAISRSSIHQSLATPSSQLAMARARSSALSDPKRALDLVRSLIQKDINAKIEEVMHEFAAKFFEPAFKNIQRNLGAENVDVKLINDVCADALEHAKSIFSGPKSRFSVAEKSVARMKRKVKKRHRKKSWGFPELTDLILISKTGRPIRREGEKWDPNRFSSDTLFILGSKASRVLGFGSLGRGRLFIKHPSLFRYRCDHYDKEWLVKNQILSTPSAKTYLLLLTDVAELTEMEKRSELRGFNCPSFMLRKISTFVKAVRTDPTTTDDELLQEAHAQISRLSSLEVPHHLLDVNGQAINHDPSNETLEDDESSLLDEIGDDDDEDDDLGFLQGVNLSSLVREFEMEASNSGSQNLAILSLADDNEEEAAATFDQLNDGAMTHAEDDLNIDFD